MIKLKRSIGCACLVAAMVAFIGLTPSTSQAAFMTIVDVDATLNGGGNPVTLPLDAGTYKVEPIGTAQGGAFDAWSAWSANAGILPAPIGTMGAQGWLNSYIALSTDITAVTFADGTPFPIVNPPDMLPTTSFFSPVLGGYFASDGMIYASAGDALANAVTSIFTLGAPGDVNFAFLDTLNDNRGGVSLKVSAVPEPGTLLLIGAGLAGMGIGTRRRNRRRVEG